MENSIEHKMTVKFHTIAWQGGPDGYAELIDQTLLPGEVRMLPVRDVRTMWDAIQRLQIRGAPAIGVAAGYGVVLGIQPLSDIDRIDTALSKVQEVCNYLSTSRPTAVNLFWALDRMKKKAESAGCKTTGELKEILLAEAQAIHEEDAAMCRAIGTNGAKFIHDGARALTHCNAGGLATSEYGTALAVLYAANEQGRQFSVFADETRPLLQGARLTAWELHQAQIDVTVICDNMAGHLMSRGSIDLVIVGADRIAANGDAANKIGTYSLAVLADAHKIPFYIAAPSSTFDLSIPDGTHIPIEERKPEEIACPWGVRTVPEGVNVYNPAFDVTPHTLISAIITEKGVIEKPNRKSIWNYF